MSVIYNVNIQASIDSFIGEFAKNPTGIFRFSYGTACLHVFIQHICTTVSKVCHQKIQFSPELNFPPNISIISFKIYFIFIFILKLFKKEHTTMDHL